MKIFYIILVIAGLTGCALPQGGRDFSYIPRYDDPGWGMVANTGGNLLDVELYRQDGNDKFTKTKEIHMSPTNSFGSSYMKINGKYEKATHVWIRLDPGQYRMIVNVFRGVLRDPGRYSYRFSVRANPAGPMVDDRPVYWLVRIDIDEPLGTVTDIVNEKLSDESEKIIEKNPY